MKEIIEKCNKSREGILSLSKSEIEKTINIIRGELEKNIDIIEEAYKVENTKPFDKELFLDSIKNEKFKYGKIQDVVKNEYGIINRVYTPYGIIGMIYDGDIYTTISMISKCIQTRNALVLSTYKNVGMIYIIVKEITKVLEQIEADELIQINSNMTDMLNSKEIEKIFYIGKREAYENLKAETPKEMEYRGYKHYEMYIDDELDKELIKKMQGISNMKIYTRYDNGIKVKDIDDAIAKINIEGGKYAVGIMTKDSNKAKKFIDEINASNVFINEAPTLTNMLNIECQDLIYRKNVILFE